MSKGVIRPWSAHFNEAFWIRALAQSRFANLKLQELKKSLAAFPIEEEKLPWLLPKVQMAAVKSEGPPPASNKDAVSGLKTLSVNLARAAKGVHSIDQHSMDLINRVGRIRANGQGGTTGGMAPPIFPEVPRLKALAREISWAANLVGDAADNVDSQTSRWKQRRERDCLVRFAIELIPVFEELTNQRATYNNWEGAKIGLWAEFYEPLVTLVWQINGSRTRAVLTLARTAIKDAIREPKKNRISP